MAPQADARAPYRLTLLGDEARARLLADLVIAGAARRLRDDRLDVSRRVPSGEHDPAQLGPHHVVVWLHAGSPASDPDLKSLADAEARDLPVLPIVVDDATLEDLPEPLPDINVLAWTSDTQVVEAVLRLLGLSEADRRLFISYRRTETTALADQLRHALTDRGFDVFVDRFDVPPGTDHQRQIDVELGDKAFMLLLESPTTRASPWIRHEVTYAQHHRVSVQALTLPEVAPETRVAELDDAFRWKLDPLDLTAARRRSARVLRDEALDRLCRRLEVLHADRLHRHRRELISTLADWLRQTGHRVIVGPEWTVIADDGVAETLYLVTPRAPNARDLHLAHLAREQRGAGIPAVVAHNPRDLDGAMVELNEWIASGRNLTTAIHEDLRDLLGAR